MNLMHFVDPKTFDDPVELEKRYEVLDKDAVTALHEQLKPYFLRRTTREVITIPPKVEIIVPVSMTSLQRELWDATRVARNIGLIESIVGASSLGMKRSNLRNVLMELRKCLNHPYLLDNVEPEIATVMTCLTR